MSDPDHQPRPEDREPLEGQVFWQPGRLRPPSARSDAPPGAAGSAPGWAAPKARPGWLNMAILLAGAAAGIGVFLLASCALAALAPLIISVLLFGLAYSGLTLPRRQGGKPTFGSRSVWLALLDLPVFLLTRSLNLSPVLLGSVCLGLGLLTSGLAGWLISVGTAGRGGD